MRPRRKFGLFKAYANILAPLLNCGAGDDTIKSGNFVRP